METPTLTSAAKRRSIKRTFLRDVTATVTFEEIDLLGNGEIFKTFLRDKFGISETINIPKLNGIDIVSDSKNERFNFTTTSVSVVMDSDIYSYFEESLKPRLDIVISFLKALGVEEVKSLSIIKRNLFHAQAENAFDAWKLAIVDAFKVGNITAMANTPNIPAQAFKMSIEGEADTIWGKIRAPFMVNVPDDKNFMFQLDLEALSQSVNVSDLIDRSILMNNEIFDTFTGIISDKLFNLMQKD